LTATQLDQQLSLRRCSLDLNTITASGRLTIIKPLWVVTLLAFVPLLKKRRGCGVIRRHFGVARARAKHFLQMSDFVATHVKINHTVFSYFDWQVKILHHVKISLLREFPLILS
jgi:hypothetical protein